MELWKGGTMLSKDERPIMSVWFFGENTGGFTVGDSNVTKIEAYDDNGSMSHVPWIAVFKGDHLAVRIPANQVSIHY